MFLERVTLKTHWPWGGGLGVEIGASENATLSARVHTIEGMHQKYQNPRIEMSKNISLSVYQRKLTPAKLNETTVHKI